MNYSGREMLVYSSYFKIIINTRKLPIGNKVFLALQEVLSTNLALDSLQPYWKDKSQLELKCSLVEKSESEQQFLYDLLHRLSIFTSQWHITMNSNSFDGTNIDISGVADDGFHTPVLTWMSFSVG